MEYHNKQDLERDRSVQISQLFGGLENVSIGPNLTPNQKLDRLEQAKSIALSQSFPSDFQNVIDNQQDFIFSGDAAKLPSLRLFKLSTSLIADLGTGFADLATEAEHAKIQSDRSARKDDFSASFYYSDRLKRIPEKEGELQAKIDKVAEVTVAVVHLATKSPFEDAKLVLEGAEKLLKLSLIGPNIKGKLQETMAQLATTNILQQDPVAAFKTGQIIAETAERDPARQVAGVDLMFAALKQHEAAGEGNAAALLLSTQPRWGVPLKSTIVQNFVDVQLTSLRAGTGLVEYSDRDTKPAADAVEVFKYQNATPKTPANGLTHTA